MKFNESGLALLKDYEGCRLDAYQDLAGVWTIGYGATGDGIKQGVIWSPMQAEARLKQDVERFSKGVVKNVSVELTDNQFSALVCLAYNIGLGNFSRSTLLQRVNEKKFMLAASEFEKWCRAAGKIVKGLQRRRQAERDLFLSGLHS
jgi:lysozyme